ncbi:hypothetical protein [Bifidobacterium moukalabense]|nr:hypothetical protein [Bifidobacterium moukalabense]
MQASRRVVGKGVEHCYQPGTTPEMRDRWRAAVVAYMAMLIPEDGVC